ncbi:MAG TPA: hypothetical protein DCQ36_08375 [Actinobacteria bacterium]|nr:hypothetical protein [Actinomycetota bacterium]
MSETELQMPSWTGAAHARNIASAAMRVTYKVHPHGQHHAGTEGSAILVCRSEGVLVGTLLHATMPRPVHVMANAAMMAALRQGMMAKAGVIPVRDDTAIEAQRLARLALEDLRAVALTGTTVHPSYLLAVTGAPLVPVVILGGEGRVATDPPRPRSRIDVYYFEPIRVDVDGDPLHATTRASLDEQIRQVMADAEHTAALRSGRTA